MKDKFLDSLGTTREKEMVNIKNVLKKTKTQAEKGKAQLEAKTADPTNELRFVSSNKQEANMKRKQLKFYAGKFKVYGCLGMITSNKEETGDDKTDKQPGRKSN